MTDTNTTEKDIKSTKILKLAVLIMTLLLFIGFSVVFYTIGYRLANNDTQETNIPIIHNKLTITSDQEILFINDAGKNIVITLIDDKNNYQIISVDKKSYNVSAELSLVRE